MGGRATLCRVGLVAVAALALAGCASVDGKVDADPHAKAVSGRELNGRIREAVAKQPTTTAHLSGAAVGAGASGVLRLERQNFGMSFELLPATGTGRMKMLVLPQGYFVSAGTKVDGKEWVKLVADQIDPISTMLGGTVQAVRTNVDLETVERVLLVAQDVEQVGAEQVEGVQATHYRMSMDKAAIKSQLPTTMSPDQAQTLLDNSTGTIDLYLDPSHLPLKVVNTVRTPGGGTGGGTVSYQKWGQPVTLPQPKAGEVLDLGSDHDVNVLNEFLARMNGVDPDVSPSQPAAQP